jgi:hypothetical protein
MTAPRSPHATPCWRCSPRCYCHHPLPCPPPHLPLVSNSPIPNPSPLLLDGPWLTMAMPPPPSPTPPWWLPSLDPTLPTPDLLRSPTPHGPLQSCIVRSLSSTVRSNRHVVSQCLCLLLTRRLHHLCWLGRCHRRSRMALRRQSRVQPSPTLVTAC